MKIILMKDIKGLGKKGDVVNANDGYARNYLLPKKLAVQADSGNLKVLNEQKKALAKKEKKEHKNACKLASALEGKIINIKAKAGEGGRLFGSVTSLDISKAIKQQTDFDIDKKKIDLDEPIRTLGSQKVEIRIYPEVTAQVIVKVVEE
ncbi:MAG: 50S ribosomal protein L9 [Clostridia bacterium]|nr:50S ribosomal protein L9 [Clostridia bacterium]